MFSCCRFKKKGSFDRYEKKSFLKKKKEPIIAKDRDYTPSEIAAIMGLNYSVDAKILRRCGSERLRVGSCATNGKREAMEDAHMEVLSLPNHPNVALFGIFDGHSGRFAAQWCAANLGSYFDRLSEFSDELLIKTCLQIDRDLRAEHIQDGCTAVFALAEYFPDKKDSKPWNLIICNIGDSRFMLVRDGKDLQFVTRDHKPEDTKEYDRIIKAGGFVANGRVDSGLALSRAFGDFEFKDNPNVKEEEQKVICIPDITRINGVGQDDFLVLSCDGLLESLTNQEIVEFIAKELKSQSERSSTSSSSSSSSETKILESSQNQIHKDLADICARLCDWALEYGSRDNLSCIVVTFEDGSDFNFGEEFQPTTQYIYTKAKNNSQWLLAYERFVKEHTKLNWNDILNAHENRKKQRENPPAST